MAGSHVNGRRWLRRSGIAAVLAMIGMVVALPAGRAQDYPARTVKIIVPFPAGGTADVMPRIVGDWLAKKWAQPVVIENRTGAAGNIGAEAVAKADPTATRCSRRRRRRSSSTRTSILGSASIRPSSCPS